MNLRLLSFALVLECFLPGVLRAQEFRLRQVQTPLEHETRMTPFLSPLADLNGDGVLDFFAGKSLYLGNGDGTFDREVISTYPLAVTGIGDIDGDGVPDLFSVSPYPPGTVTGEEERIQQVEVRRATWDADRLHFPVLHSFPVIYGGLDAPPYLLFSGPIADLDGDGKSDLLAVGEVSKSLPEGGSNMFPQLALPAGTGSGAFGSFEFFFCTPEDKHNGRPFGSFRLRPQPLVADLNNDHLPDVALPVATETPSGLISVLLNDGGKGFGAARAYETVDAPQPIPASMDAADADQDGDLDLLVGHLDRGAFAVLLNDGEGAFEAGTVVCFGDDPVLTPPAVVCFADDPNVGNPYSVSGADLNGDNAFDVIAFDGGDLILVFHVLDPVRRSRVVLRTQTQDLNPDMMRVGDLNADGLLDVVLNGGVCEHRHIAPCNLSVFLGELSGEFLRGDANADSVVDVSDAVAILGHLFLGRGAPKCLDSADADDNGAVEITDAIRILGYLFLGYPEPPPPFGSPGLDVTLDDLFCRRGE